MSHAIVSRKFPTLLLTRNQVRTESPAYKTHHIIKF
jgi:hypothetical protein